MRGTYLFEALLRGAYLNTQPEDRVSILHKELECKVEIEFKHEVRSHAAGDKKQIWNFQQVQKTIPDQSTWSVKVVIFANPVYHSFNLVTWNAFFLGPIRDGGLFRGGGGA